MKTIKRFFNWVKSFFCKSRKKVSNGTYYNIGSTIGGGKL